MSREIADGTRGELFSPELGLEKMQNPKSSKERQPLDLEAGSGQKCLGIGAVASATITPFPRPA